MATWNQGVNSGGLLAGIGQSNINAPQASDVNATLSMIRENNERQRSGANNVGLQALQGLQGISELYKADQQAQRQQEFFQKYGTARAAGDTASMRQLFAEYPEMNEQIGKGMTGISADTKESIGNLAAGFRTAAATGSGDQFVAKNAAEFLRVGVDPADLQKRLKEDPDSAVELADWVGLSAVGSEKYFDIIDAKEGRQIDREKLAETVRSNQAGEALQARGQDISRANALTSAYAPTAAMQNYNQYAQMLKADPEGAAAFAAAAGINPNAKKLLKVETNPDGSVTKYYTDGSEEAGKLNQPISGDGIKPISLSQAQSIIDKANEGSKKAAGFALRLKDSMDSMNQLSKSIDPKRVALINRSLGDGTIANLSLSPAEQQYMVNARDALYAILRPETGAAITLPEMQEYSKMYLPQPGDSKAATETKMRKMQGQYNSLRGQSGRVYDALVVSSAANSQQQSNSQQPTNTQQQQSQSGSYTSKSGIQFTVE
ncbi:TPA: DNA transfer protein [Salmonella enterica]|nr:DNA transfer protein [Salmonella enterica]HEA0393435.1 DNA transfer protein [Salmonella enterica]